MKLKIYLKRVINYIINGIPKEEVYVRVAKVQYSELLKGKKILITGGSSGIGFEIAKRCIELGADVCITGKNNEKLIMAQKKLGECNCKIVQWDIADINSLEDKINKTIENIGKIDILVNNAGIGLWKNYNSYTEDDYNNMLEVNLKGTYFLTQKICKYFIDNSIKGNILMIASEAGIIGDVAPYGISKAGMIHLTKGLAKEMIKHQIRVNAIAPGVTVTSISEDNSKYNPKGDLYRESTIGKRALLPEEIAEVAVWLVSDTSKCINGEIIVCDEGNTLS